MGRWSGLVVLCQSSLLERWIVEDISKASVVDLDPVCVVFSYPYVDDECIVMRVVETSGIIF